MQSTELSAKGQIVLPKSVRDAHGWVLGDEFAVEDAPGGVLLRPRSGAKPGENGDLVGALKRNGGKPVSLEAMETAIAAEVKARRARGRYKRSGSVFHG